MINTDNMPIDVGKLIEKLQTTIADLQLQVALKDCVNQELVKRLEVSKKPQEIKRLERLTESNEGDKNEQDTV